jgi:DNA primase
VSGYHALDAKEHIRQAVDIVDLLGSYLSLRREGRLFKALCPWHDDTRPSLTVDPQRQTFRCWVCNIGGDVFSFVMRREGVSFGEALRLLAQRAGIPLPDTAGAPADQTAAKQRWRELMAWVEEQYHHCLLHDPQAEPARRYLQQRGIAPQSIRRFRLGFAPPQWGWIEHRARQAGHRPEELAQVGVLARSQRGGFYDRFRGRVLFPIRDAQGHPVGLGGRVLPGDDAQAAKYINSPETPLFSKSRLLYGLNWARDAITRSRIALVVEGYTDCVLAMQHGIENVVAVLGTALGEAHLRLLRPLANQIVLVLDGDEAGRRRTREILPLFVAHDVDLRVMSLPEGMDPADYLQRHGAGAWRQLLETASDALQFKLDEVSQRLRGQAEAHEVHQALEDILRTLAAVPHGPGSTRGAALVREGLILSRLSHTARVPEATLRQRLSELRQGRADSAGRRRAAGAAGAAASGPGLSLSAWERDVFELVLVAPELFHALEPHLDPATFSSPAAARLFGACCAACVTGQLPTLERLLLELEDADYHSLLVELHATGQAKRAERTSDELRDEATALLQTLSDRALHHDVQQRLHVLHTTGTDDLSRQVQELQHIVAQQQRRQGLLSTDG